MVKLSKKIKLMGKNIMKHHQTTNNLLSLIGLHRLVRRPLAIAGLILASTVVATSVITTVQATGSTTLYLSPASSTTTVGSTLAVTVRENSGSTAVNAVEADLSYPSALLQYSSTDFSTSAFEIGAGSTGGSGSITMARGTVNSSLSGDQIVGIVNFKVLASGSATANFLNSSAVTSTANNTNTIGTMTGGTYSLQNPPASSPPATTTTKPATTTTTTKPATTTTTTKPTTTPSTPSATTPLATPAVPAASVTYLVAIKVLDAQGKPQAGDQVTLAGITAVSDATGVASFPSVTAGSHQLTIKHGSTTQKESMTVSSTKSPTAVQEFQYKLASTSAVPVVVWLIICLLVIIGLGTIFLRRSRLHPDLAYSQAPVEVFHESNLPTPNGLPTANVGQIIQPTVPATNLVDGSANSLITSDQQAGLTPPADYPTPITEQITQPPPLAATPATPPVDINHDQFLSK